MEASTIEEDMLYIMKKINFKKIYKIIEKLFKNIKAYSW